MRPPRLGPRLGFGLVAVVWIGIFVVGAYQDAAAPPLFALSVPMLHRMGAIFLPLSSSRELWRLVTAWLLHVDTMHLAANLLALLGIAWHWPSHKRVLGPLVLGVVASGAASLLVPRQVATICAGGSGVLLALFPVAMASAPSRRWTALLGVAATLLFVAGFLPSGEWPAHVGGLLAGALWLTWVRARA